MRKIAKLSLVAAVAVAGLTTANAGSLESAIKNVNVSGQFRFRAQDQNDTDAANVSTNTNGTDVEVEVGVKVPVTDTVTAVFKIDNDNNDTDASDKGAVTIEDYYFSYAANGTTVNFGQQNIPGRMTDGAQGDGVVALQKVGGFTVGAAAFMTNSVTSADDVYSVIAMGAAGPVSLLAQYATIPDTLDAYNLKADAKVAMAKVGVEYTSKDLETGNAKYSTTKVYAAAKMDMISAKIAYAATGKDGSGSIDAGAETPSELLLWNVGTFGKKDLTAFVVDASLAVNKQVSIRAAYLDGEHETNTDVSEVLGQISYKAAKNLNTYLRVAHVENGATERDRGRIEVRYSF